MTERTYTCKNPYCNWVGEFVNGRLPESCESCNILLTADEITKPPHRRNTCEECGPGGDHGPERD